MRSIPGLVVMHHLTGLLRMAIATARRCSLSKDFDTSSCSASSWSLSTLGRYSKDR